MLLEKWFDGLQSNPNPPVSGFPVQVYSISNKFQFHDTERLPSCYTHSYRKVTFSSLCSSGMTLHLLVIGAQCFKTAWWSHIKSQNVIFVFWLLNVRPPCHLKTMGTNHPVTQSHIPRSVTNPWHNKYLLTCMFTAVTTSKVGLNETNTVSLKHLRSIS